MQIKKKISKMKKESDQSSKDLCMLSEGIVKTKTERNGKRSARTHQNFICS